MSENQAAFAVAGGIFVLMGGLKAAFWPWMLRRRSWARRASDDAVSSGHERA